MRSTRSAWRYWLVLVAIFIGAHATAQSIPPEVQRADNWLRSQFAANGQISGTSIANAMQAQSESARAQALTGTIPAPLLAQLENQADGNTEYLARRVLAKLAAGQSVDSLRALIRARQNADGGFAASLGYTSNALDTTWALLALRQAPSNDGITPALSYLLTAINSDGSVGQADLATRPVLTSLCLQVLASYAPSASVGGQITQLKNYLVSQQTNGSYAKTIANMQALLALKAATSDSTVFTGLTAHIKATQLANGSWENDAYLTALGIRALLAAANDPPAPNVGDLNATIVDASNQQPLLGAQASLVPANGSNAVQSAADGVIRILNLPAGSYTLNIAKPGFIATTRSLSISAGATTALGVIALQQANGTAILRGVVSNAADQTPLAGVLIQLGGVNNQQATTDAQGRYELNGLTAGASTIALSKSGFQSQNANATLPANSNTVFSPALVASGQNNPTSAELKGRIIDADTAAVIDGVQIAVATASTQSNAQGNFTIANLAAGSFSASLSKAGYQSATLSGVLALGVNNAGDIRLQKLANNTLSALRGRIISAQNQQPIAGARVDIEGLNVGAQTAADGRYEINGIVGSSFVAKVSAAGFLGQRANFFAQAPNLFQQDFSLAIASASGMAFEPLVTGAPFYQSYAEAIIGSELRNETSSEQRVNIFLEVRNGDGQIVFEAPEIRPDLPPGARVVPANARYPVTVNWPVQSAPAGTYLVHLMARSEAGDVRAERSTSVRIETTRRMAGMLKLDPPISQDGLQQPINIDAEINNRGNVPIPAGNVDVVVRVVNNDQPKPPSVTAREFFTELRSQANNCYARDAAGLHYYAKTRDIWKLDANAQASLAFALPATIAGGNVGLISDCDLLPDGSWVFSTTGSPGLIVKRSAAGAYSQFSSLTNSAPHLRAAAGGAVYVTGFWNNTMGVSRFDAAGNRISVLAGGISQAEGIAYDGTSKLIVANYNTGTVAKVDATTGSVSPWISGLDRPRGMVREASGNFLIAESGANRVIRIDSAGTVTSAITALNDPIDVDVTSNGAILTLDSGNDRVLTTSNGTTSVFYRSISRGYARAARYDNAGNLYVSDINNTVSKLATDGSVSRLFTVPFGAVMDIEFATNGDLYAISNSQGNIWRWNAGMSQPQAVNNSVTGANRMALDSDGSIVVYNGNDGTISRLNTAGVASKLVESALVQPREIVVAPDDSLYLIDTSWITKVTSTGTSVFNRTVSFPMAVTTAPSGTVFVRNQLGEVFKLDANGVATSFLTGLENNVGTIAAESDTSIVYSGTQASKTLVRKNATGTSVVATFADAVRRVAVGADGTIYTLTGNGTVSKISTAGVVSALAQTLSAQNMSIGKDGNLYLTISNGVERVDATTGVKTLVYNRPVSAPSATAATLDASGSLRLVYTSEAMIRAFAPNTTTELSNVTGFQALNAMDAYQGGFLLADQAGRIAFWQSGQSPRLLRRYVHSANASVNGNTAIINDRTTVTRMNALDASAAPTSLPAGIVIDAIALASNGSYAVIDQVIQGVQLFDVNHLRTAVYPVTYGAKSIAVAPNGEVYIPQPSFIARFSSAGLYLGKLDFGCAEIAFAPNSDLYCASLGYFTKNLTTNTDYAFHGTGRIAFVGNQAFASSPWNAVYKLQAPSATIFASGAPSPMGLDVQSDGSVLVAENSNRTILRVQPNGAFTTVATGLMSVFSVRNIGDRILAGSSQGELYSIQGDTVRDLNIKALADTTGGVIGMSTNGTRTWFMSNNGFIHELTIPTQPSLPAPGTELLRRTVAMPELAPGNTTVNLSFGNWLPPTAGTFDIVLTPQTSGVESLVSNQLYVGPYVDAALAATRSQARPGTDRIASQLSLRGVNARQLTQLFPTQFTVFAPSLMFFIYGQGTNDAGRTHILAYAQHQNQAKNSIYRLLPASMEHLFDWQSGALGSFRVDEQGNSYIPGAANVPALPNGQKTLYKISPTGTATAVASFPDQIVRMATNRSGKMWIVTQAQVSNLYEVSTSGVVTRVSTVPTGLLSFEVDEQGVIYAQFLHQIVRKPVGGDWQLLIDNTWFEGEGKPFAKACGETLLFAPQAFFAPLGFGWEEADIYSLNTRTLQYSQTLGSATNPASDPDYFGYDPINQRLVMFGHNNQNAGTMPVRCGGIQTEVHITTAPGESLLATVPTPTSQTTMANGAKRYVYQISEVPNNVQSLSFDAMLNGLTLGERRPIVQEAYLLFKNTFAPTQNVRVPLQIPQVLVGNIVQSNLTLDAASYLANAPVQVRLEMRNEDNLAVSGELLIAVIDQQGNLVRELLRENTTIGGAQSLIRTPPFNTGSILIGNYQVRAELRDAGQLLARATAALAITSGNNQAALSTSVSTDKASYAANDLVSLAINVRNLTSNTLQSQLLSTTVIKKPDGSALQSFASPVFELTPASNTSFNFELALQRASAGTYTVEQTVSTGSTALATATTNFTVRSSNNDFSTLRGTLSATPTSLETGMSTRLLATVTNTGNAAMAQAPLTISVINVIDQQVIKQWNIARDLSLTAAANIEQTWETLGTAPGNYVAVLSVGDQTNRINLAQAEIQLASPTISYAVEQRIERDTRLLVLVSCPSRIVDVNCVNLRKQWIANYLSSKGIEHSIVSTVENFASEFRSGRYNTYWLAGGAQKLKGGLPRTTDTIVRSGFEGIEDRTSLLDELRERVFAGESVWLDGNYEALNFDWYSAMGVSYQGAAGTALIANLIPGVYVAGQLTTTGVAERFTVPNHLQVHANFADANQTPAIIEGRLGDGRMLLMAFDYLDVLRAQSVSGSVADNVFERSLLRILPGVPTQFAAGAYVPITTLVSNQFSQEVITEISAKLPVGASVDRMLPANGNVTGTTTSGLVISWRMPIPALEQRRFEVGLRLNNIGLAQKLELRVSSVRANNVVVPFGEYAVSLDALGGDTLIDAISQRIAAYPLVATSELVARASMLQFLSTMRTANAEQRYADAISAYIDVTELFADIRSISVNTERRQGALLLHEAQKRWAMLLPACITGSAAPQTLTMDNFRSAALANGVEIRGGDNSASGWEIALGPDTRNTALSARGDVAWINGRDYRYELTIAPTGNGSLLIKDGAQIVTTVNFTATASNQMLRGNALQLVMRSYDTSGATLAATLDELQSQPTNLQLSSAQIGSKQIFHDGMRQQLSAKGNLRWTFTSPLPPAGDLITLQLLPGRAACLSPFPSGEN
jgi:sugar lactone lactonase YvrE